MKNEVFENKILEIIDINSEKKIVFWGASLFLENFLKKQPKKIQNVIGIIDNNSQKWGQFLYDYPIYPVEKLKNENNVLIIITIQNDAERFYRNITKQINILNNHTLSISANIFNNDNNELSRQNNIFIIKNNIKQKVEYIDGLDIKFEGINNTIEIYGDPLPRFINCVMQIKNNNYVKIDSSKHVINQLNFRLEGDCSKLIIGKDFSIRGGMMLLDNNLELEIGDNCMFSSGIYLRTTDGHAIFDNTTKKVLNKSETKSIVIGNHVWLGNSVTVMKNSKISDNSVVGKSSIVTKKFETPNVLLVGSPAKIAKTNINWDRRSPEQYEKEVASV